jgi:S1-C subfamily serine protease
VTRVATVVLAATLALGCARVPSPGRSAIIQRLLPSTVQLRAEYEGGVRRAGSGVVVATAPAQHRAWVLTTRHLLESRAAPRVLARRSGARDGVPATVVARSADADLALVQVDGLDLEPAAIKVESALGDEVVVIAFPWGRRLTVVSGIVSQLDAHADGGIPVAGAVRMVDASVSYGSSGGGVFDAGSGALLGVVEGYRTASVRPADGSQRTIELPVAGETAVIPAAEIVRFLATAGVEARLAP